MCGCANDVCFLFFKVELIGTLHVCLRHRGREGEGDIE